MNLYEIKSEIENIMTTDENGELDNDVFEKLEQLAIAENQKIENVGLYIKNLNSDADQIKQEVKALQARQKSLERKAERLKAYLSSYLLDSGKTKYSTSRIDLSFRKSEQVQCDESILPAKYWRIKKEVDKAGIKKLLKSGTKVKGASLVEVQNIQIK